MSYSLVIEGLDGAHRVRRGDLPRQGEWLGFEFEGAFWWLPVIEVAHVLTDARPIEEAGCDYVHEAAGSLVFSSFALAVRTKPQVEEESVKFVFPPTRWPFGGRLETGEANAERNGKGIDRS